MGINPFSTSKSHEINRSSEAAWAVYELRTTHTQASMNAVNANAVNSRLYQPSATQEQINLGQAATQNIAQQAPAVSGESAAQAAVNAAFAASTDSHNGLLAA